jgi:gliding motility-associated-like protein
VKKKIFEMILRNLIKNYLISSLFNILIISLASIASFLQAADAQNFIFAQLKGAPVDTTGWSFGGAAKVGNIKYNDNSEIVLCPARNSLTSTLFYNQKINLSQCTKWTAEFDMRIFDGTGGDGIVFCFLDEPQIGLGVGGGMGIPPGAKGLKICFDQYSNCGGFVPKIEMRWGSGYNECWTQPTKDNTDGTISFIRSDNYNHVKIYYDAGNIDVYINNTLYLSGYQQFNFTGFLGFTSSTGGKNDNHSIRNVVIYTDMPKAFAGNDLTLCSGQSAQVGGPSSPENVYNWLPATGLSASNVSDPYVSLINTTTGDIAQKYYVQTALATSSACYSTDSVLVTVRPATQKSTVQPVICSGATYTLPSGKTVSATGLYMDTVKNTPGCDSLITTVNLTVITPRTAAIDAALCKGETYTLPSGKAVNTSGLYNDTAHSLEGCDSLITTLHLTVKEAETVNIDTVICGGQKYNLPSGATAETPGLYKDTLKSIRGCDSLITLLNLTVNMPETVTVDTTISNGQTFLLPSGRSVTHSGVYADTLRSTNGCDSLVTTLTLSVDTPLQITKEVSGCKDSTVAVGTDGFITYLWNTGETSSFISVSKNGTYTLTVTDSIGCKANDTFNAVMYDPQINLNKNIILCKNGSTTIDAGGGYVSYLWNTGSTRQAISIQSTGPYWVSATDEHGCSASDTTVVSTIAASASDFLPPGIVKCSLSDIVLKPTRPFISYLWNTGSTSDYITVREPGQYWLEITDSNNCRVRDTLVLKDSICTEDLYMPTAFTPNGDGRNDIFRQSASGSLSEYKLIIYSRWGQKIFNTADPTKGWDGTYNGNEMPAGTYVWQVSYKQTNGMFNKKGTVVLIR